MMRVPLDLRPYTLASHGKSSAPLSLTGRLGFGTGAIDSLELGTRTGELADARRAPPICGPHPLGAHRSEEARGPGDPVHDPARTSTGKGHGAARTAARWCPEPVFGA